MWHSWVLVKMPCCHHSRSTIISIPATSLHVTTLGKLFILMYLCLPAWWPDITAGYNPGGYILGGFVQPCHWRGFWLRGLCRGYMSANQIRTDTSWELNKHSTRHTTRVRGLAASAGVWLRATETEMRWAPLFGPLWLGKDFSFEHISNRFKQPVEDEFI